MSDESAVQNLEATVQTIRGDIRRMSEFEEGTWQSSAQVSKSRVTDASVRNDWFYANNHALNDVEDDDAFLYFGSNNDSIFRADTIDDAFRQLRDSSTGNYYRPGSEDVSRAKQTSLKLRISELQLKGDESLDYGYFEVDTSDLNGEKFETDAQRQFAEAVYGSMVRDEKGKSDYSRTMEMLNDEGVKVARIYTLRKETVLRDAKKGAVARACWLYVDFSSNFVAVDGDVSGHYGLRGVLSQKTAVGGGALDDEVKSVDPIAEAYKTLLANPVNAVSQATPEQIAGISSIVTRYLSKGKE